MRLLEDSKHHFITVRELLDGTIWTVDRRIDAGRN